MIDKKPFRVTNEQIKIDLMLYDDDIECAKYAADLLDARELIDKQEALIKQMRGYIANMIEHNSDTIYITEGANILEKTKDYAE